MERSTGACILTAQGISATRTSIEASKPDETVRSENRCIWSSSHTVTGERRKLYQIGYTSKKLSLGEAKNPIIEKECLAVVWGIRLYIAGKRLQLQTDHKLLKYLKDAAYQMSVPLGYGGTRIFLLMDRLSFVNIYCYLCGFIMHFNNDVLFIILIFY